MVSARIREFKLQVSWEQGVWKLNTERMGGTELYGMREHSRKAERTVHAKGKGHQGTS